MQTFQYQLQEDSSSLWKILCFCKFMQCSKRKRINKNEKIEADKEDANENEIKDTVILQNNDNALSGDEQEVKKKDDFFSLLNSSKEKNKKASINFYSYEFDHILKGDKGMELIKYLS